MRDFTPSTIILDVDGTLLDSPPCDGDYAAWERRILAESCPPVPGAVEGVAALLARYPDAAVHVLTARSVALAQATVRRLIGAFGPRFEPVAWDGATGYTFAEGAERKRSGLAHLLAEGPALILDDDASLVEWIRPVDCLLLAPACWAELVAAPVAA